MTSNPGVDDTTLQAQASLLRSIADLPMVDMQAAVYDCNVSNGWFDSGRSFGTDLALLHSEVSEMFEAFRDWGFKDMTDSLCGSCATSPGNRPHPGLCKPQGVGSEAADILIRALDHAQRHELPITLAQVQAFEMDWEQPEEFGEWIAMLHKAIADIEGTPISEPWSAYCALLSLLYYGCAWHQIDLPAEYTRKLAFNRTRGYKHGGKSV